MQGSAGLVENGGGWERAWGEAQTRTPGPRARAPGSGSEATSIPKDTTLAGPRQVNGLCVQYHAARCHRAGSAQAQAEVSKRRSIMSPTCSTWYLMYFSGFLVKGTLPYLPGTEVSGERALLPTPRSLRPPHGVSLRQSTEPREVGGGGGLTCAERPRRSP